MLKQLVTGVAITLGAMTMMTTTATAVEQPTGPEVCLSAPDLRTYIPCEALRTQPEYMYANPDGSTVDMPNGAAMLAELADEGITPNGTPADFRDFSRTLIEEYYGHSKGSEREDGSPCLTATGSGTYALCATLWEQDSYDLEDGSGLSSPTGSEIIAELQEEGVTPSQNVARFRWEALNEVSRYFDQFSR